VAGASAIDKLSRAPARKPNGPGNHLPVRPFGIGDKEVAVPLDHLQLGDGEAYLMSAETEEELKQMPAYDENQYQPHAQQ
jgi:hypothetical protein